MTLDADLINELQTKGARLVDPHAGVDSRRGGAGPSDHKAMTLGDQTIMLPVHTAPAFQSPYVIDAPNGTAGDARVLRDGTEVGRIRFPGRPRFYDLTTADGIPYSQFAVLHVRDVLATTVLQTCIRYESARKPASSAPSAKAWPMAAPLPTRPPRNWPKWPGRRSNWTASGTWR